MRRVQQLSVSHSHVPNLPQVQQGKWYSLLPYIVLISYLNLILSALGKKVLDDATYLLQTAAKIERLRSRINDAAVCKHASSLNGGRSCTIEHSSKIGPGTLMGSANYHARICFHDGSPSWLLRLPPVASFAVGLPSSLVEYLVLSEYATLKFLETTAVPAPRAFGYGIYGTGTVDAYQHFSGTMYVPYFG
jgi:hypothetical protein